MSNNKLYTEEELRKHLYNHSDEFFEKLTPIELPSDEDICKEAHSFYKLELQYKAFIQGAKSLRDKIGGNNEQQ